MKVSQLRRMSSYDFARIKVTHLSDERQLPEVGVVHVRLPARYTHRTIVHRKTREWLMILKGRGEGLIGGRTVAFKPGTVVYMPPGTPHRMGTGSVPLEALVVFSPPLDARDPKADICHPAPPRRSRARLARGRSRG